MSKRNCRSKFVPRWDEEPEQDTLYWSEYNDIILSYHIADRFRKESESVGNVHQFTKEVMA
jgi:hypothetical protein